MASPLFVPPIVSFGAVRNRNYFLKLLVLPGVEISQHHWVGDSGRLRGSHNEAPTSKGESENKH